MDRSLKKLLRLYPIARNWAVLSNQITPFPSVQSLSRIYNTSLTDHTQVEDFPLLKRNNYVSDDIKMNKSMEILEKAATNYTNMTVHDVVHTMSTLFDISKDVKDIQIIKEHIGFIRLCKIINKDIRLIKTHDIVQILKIFIYFKLPSHSVVIQSLLQMIRTTINEMPLQNIMFLNFLLKKMDSTPLRDALLIALPLVFEAQLPTKLESDNIANLIWSLRYVNENNINNAVIKDIIFKSLWKYENDLNVQTACNIFYNLCSMHALSPIAFELLSKVQEILTANAKKLHIEEIIKILEKLTFVTTMNKNHGDKFYSETLVDACVNSALYSNINFNSGIYLLKLLNDLNYAHIPFLEYLAAKCFQDPNLLKDASYFKVSVFLEGLNNADYKPVFWDIIRDAIFASEVENKFFRKSMIKFALHLTALDCYNPNLLKKIFSENIKIRIDKWKNIYAKEILLLYQSVKTLYPTYDGPLPSQEILEYAFNISPTFPKYSIKAALELALGGPQYICNNLRTKLGHHIDHVVVMRKGGYPVAINTVMSNETNTLYIEDIPAPSESQIILIFNLPDTAYAVNSQRLKSTWLLRIKSAEELTKSDTIAINSTSWAKLSEYEKVPYLMQAIRLKCEDLSDSVN